MYSALIFCMCGRLDSNGMLKSPSIKTFTFSFKKGFSDVKSLKVKQKLHLIKLQSSLCAVCDTHLCGDFILIYTTCIKLVCVLKFFIQGIN